MILFDLMSKSYVQTLHDNVTLISGSQVMPQSTSSKAFIAKIINISAATLYPIALSLLMPVFMQTIVLEKEERLREIMKMNGLKMRNYWLVNFVWFFVLYVAAVLIFIGFGRYVLDTDFFNSMNFTVLLVSLLGWGLCQVSLSFFYQNFISKAKTAMSKVFFLIYFLPPWKNFSFNFLFSLFMSYNLQLLDIFYHYGVLWLLQLIRLAFSPHRKNSLFS